MLDLDGFKSVNDRHGHKAGDQLLIEASRHWQKHLRDTDTLARMGGDEFAVIIGGLAKLTMVASVAKKLIEAVSSPIVLSPDLVCQVGVSVGIAIYPNNALEIDALLSAADSAMYESKKRGKNTLSFSSANP